AIDSTRGKSRRSRLFPWERGRPARSFFAEGAGQRSGQDARPPRIGWLPKTEGPEIRPLSELSSLRPRNLRRAAVRRRVSRRAAATERIEIEGRWRAGCLSRCRPGPGVLDDRSRLAIDARQN